MSARNWQSLKHLSVDPPAANADHTLASLQAFIDSGSTPALQALDLSRLSAHDPGLQGWLKLGRRLPRLVSLTYAPRSPVMLEDATTILEAFPRVRRLHCVAPLDCVQDFETVGFGPEVVDLLANLPLERLIVDVWDVLDDAKHELEELGCAAVKELSKYCKALEGVRLRYIWTGLKDTDYPYAVAEYTIKKSVEVTSPRLLQGTAAEFLDRR
ncbi:hypothetical protein DFH06DRAFT_1473834 [Mycena polygramma]|nr:hypothetical protein DFH06DRAFT_1473834 [Mycena polygramma]